MYEMQGPRLAGQCKLADCPDELVHRANRRTFAQSVHHRSRTPAAFLVIRSLVTQFPGHPVSDCPVPPRSPELPLR